MKSIHFILPGGGVKGSFQGGFLYELDKSAKDLFTISRIDGTSVGALNGYAFSLGRLQDIYDIWFNISSIHDIFENWTELPYLSNITCGYRLLNNYGLYGTNNLRKLICDVEDKACHNTKCNNNLGEIELGKDGPEKGFPLDLDNPNNGLDLNKENIEFMKNDKETPIEHNLEEQEPVNNLDKFNCVVTCIRGGGYNYINGNNTHIKDFIVASASPWIVTCPSELDGELYTDGGLLHTFPTDFIGKTDSDITIILGYDDIYHNTFGPEGTNTLSYLSRIIDIVRMDGSNLRNIKKIKQENIDNVVFIENDMNMGFLDFNTDNIKRGFNNGREMAKQFISDYLLDK